VAQGRAGGRPRSWRRSPPRRPRPPTHSRRASNA
jgi:hypothetical protein